MSELILQKTFRSRISILLVIFILAVLAPMSARAIVSGNIPAVCILGATSLFILLIFVGIKYEISGNKLFLNILGARIHEANISEIISVKRSYDPLSSPAASLKRLSIKFRKGTQFQSLLISPAREGEFIDLLRTVNPGITVNISENKAIWCRPQDWDI